MIDSYNNVEESKRVFYTDYNADIVINDFVKAYKDQHNLILCIGTDRYIGDCLGPVTGSLLKKYKLDCPIFGTLENPVHAVNLKKYITHIYNDYPKHKIIAIDACLGGEDCIGSIQARRGSIFPGKGVGKSLPPIGDLSIIGIVDSTENNEFLSVHNIRLNTVMKMAETISRALYKALK